MSNVQCACLVLCCYFVRLLGNQISFLEFIKEYYLFSLGIKLRASFMLDEHCSTVTALGWWPWLAVSW